MPPCRRLPTRSVVASIAASLLGCVANAAAMDAPVPDPGPSSLPPASASGPAARSTAPPDATVASLSALDGWSLHAQTTVIRDQHWGFHSPYQGANSLTDHDDTEHTWTATAFVGRRLWTGAAAYIDPELSQGAGFDGTVGIAGEPNGEAVRTTSNNARYYIARYYVRQIVGLGGGATAVEDDEQAIRGQVDQDRIVITVGRFAATDIFDANSYTHDPRTQFLNWALMDTGAWDYPADTRGYTGGAVVEWITPDWAFRLGTFMEPAEANGEPLDTHLSHAHGDTAELELDYQLAGHGGKTRILAFDNHADMGDYRQALDDPAAGLDVTRTRSWSSKYGFGLNCEQALSDWAGAFLRLGWNDGHTETWAFTEIDRSAALGCSIMGTPWKRSRDVVGLAALANGLSPDHRRYLAAGGLGFIIGDGRLDYAPEEILECYYAAQVTTALALTLDYQFVRNPAYNHDRGPVSIVSVRGHVAF